MKEKHHKEPSQVGKEMGCKDMTHFSHDSTFFLKPIALWSKHCHLFRYIIFIIFQWGEPWFLATHITTRKIDHLAPIVPRYSRTMKLQLIQMNGAASECWFSVSQAFVFFACLLQWNEDWQRSSRTVQTNTASWASVFPRGCYPSSDTWVGERHWLIWLMIFTSSLCN